MKNVRFVCIKCRHIVSDKDFKNLKCSKCGHLFIKNPKQNKIKENE